MAIHYEVHLPGGGTVNIDAAAINLGFNKLWFYDIQDNLLAVFRWESIAGFTIKDSAEGQVITDDLLHEKKQVEDLEVRKGPILATVERIHRCMQEVVSNLNSGLVKIYDYTKDPHETAVLRSRYGDEVRRGLQQLADDQAALQSKLRNIADHLGSMLAKS